MVTFDRFFLLGVFRYFDLDSTYLRACAVSSIFMDVVGAGLSKTRNLVVLLSIGSVSDASVHEQFWAVSCQLTMSTKNTFHEVNRNPIQV